MNIFGLDEMTIAFVECWVTLKPKELKIDLELKDKVVVITGGSAGIGLAVAHGLAKEGVHILLCARDETRVAKMATEIATTHGVMALGVPADLSRAEDSFGGSSFITPPFAVNNRSVMNPFTTSLKRPS